MNTTQTKQQKAERLREFREALVIRDSPLCQAARDYLAALGRIGGRKGSRADKVRAGKLGAQARYGKKQPTKATT